MVLKQMIKINTAGPEMLSLMLVLLAQVNNFIGQLGCLMWNWDEKAKEHVYKIMELTT